LPLEFDIRYQDLGFKDDGNRTDICANGTFFNNSGSLTSVTAARSSSPWTTTGRSTASPPRALSRPPRPKGLANNLISSDADWVTLESTVSTSPDQIAIVPGYLEGEWIAGGRRYFHYKMDAKILDFYSVLSGRYQVRRDRWVNPLGALGAPSPEVSLEIYYHPATSTISRR